MMRKKARELSWFFSLNKRNNISQRPIHGFTAAELLTVTAIICVLAALLFPSLQTAREMAYRVVCQNNIRQQYVMFYAYAQDHDHAWAPTRQWYDLPSGGPDDGANAYSTRLLIYWGYIDGTYDSPHKDLFYCPSNKKIDVNGDGTGDDGAWRGGFTNGWARGKDVGYPYFGWWDVTTDGYSSPKRLGDTNATILIQDRASYDGPDYGFATRWSLNSGDQNHPMPGLQSGFVDGHVEWFDRDVEEIAGNIPMWEPSYK